VAVLELVLLENEVKVLNTLGRLSGEGGVEELSQTTGLTVDQVVAAAYSLMAKKVLDILETRSLRITLTDEGTRYYTHGLPERRLLKWAQTKGRPYIEEFREAGVEEWEAPIGFLWLKRKGWAQVVEENGRKSLATKDGVAEGFDEQVLQLIGSRRVVSSLDLPVGLQDGLRQLWTRKLVSTAEVVERRLRLTDVGLGILRGEVTVAEEVSRLTRELIVTGKWKNVRLKKYDVTLPSYPLYMGKKHFVRQALEYMRRIWVEMGFKEMKGPILETSFWDFDALYVPQDHPARDMQDTFYMKKPSFGNLPAGEIVERVAATQENGWTTGSTGWRYRWDEGVARQCLLRTHTTSLSARTLATLSETDLPAKFFSVGKIFRNEALSWKSLCEFYQTDGIVVDENVNFRHLLGYWKRYFSKLGFQEARFRPAYFPYTEPSVEIEVYHPVYGQWMELGGAGVFRPEVVKPLFGRDIPVLAWGPGLSRMIMVNYGITDIRELHSNDLQQLREAKAWLGE